jgi:hypothetical protein
MRRSIQDSLRHLLATLAFSLSAHSTASIAQEQGKQPAPPGFDYWQPEWMTRELWGAGHMPKSMMARLLRHMVVPPR